MVGHIDMDRAQSHFHSPEVEKDEPQRNAARPKGEVMAIAPGALSTQLALGHFMGLIPPDDFQSYEMRFQLRAV